MPIEIRELIIRANIGAKKKDESSASPDPGSKMPEKKKFMEIIEQLSDIERLKKER